MLDCTSLPLKDVQQVLKDVLEILVGLVTKPIFELQSLESLTVGSLGWENVLALHSTSKNRNNLKAFFGVIVFIG